MNINFMLLEMTYLRYFMPLIIEARRRGLTCKVFYGSNKKYNNPAIFMDDLTSFSERHGFELYPLREKMPSHPAPVTFLLEGRGHALISYKTKKVSLTSTGDFALCYETYVQNVDNIVMLSQFLAKYYSKLSPKNLYLGSPKFDVDLNENGILQKYGLPKTKKALILYPNLRPSMCPKWHKQYPKKMPDYLKFNLEHIY